MMQERTHGRVARLFDILVNVATATTCVIVCVVVVPRYWSTTAKGVDYLPVGAEAPQVQGVDYGASPATIVVGIRSNCTYCTDSMPAYRSLLAELAGKSIVGARVVFVGLEDPSVMKDYLTRHGLPAVSLARVPPGAPLVRATPTLVVLGADGRIRGSWLGRIDESLVRKVVRAIP